MAYTSEKIKDVVNKIEKGEYILPAIQREFVWKAEQIEKLFDSIMRGYPISSFLYWKVELKTLNEFDFYKFIKIYNQFNGGHNQKLEEEKILHSYTAILDGQQRLTSLYIALKGFYAYKNPGKRYDNRDNYPLRELYLNIISESANIDMEYQFSFKTKEEALEKNSNTFWFKVKDILEKDITDILFGVSIITRDYTLEQSKFAHTSLTKLNNEICNLDNINYFLEQEQNQNRVLDIFIRTNSGGTKLSYSDLLLSIATAQWQNDTNAREIIIQAVDEINKIGDGFNVDKDFILKTCLLLTGKEIAFRIENFTKEKMSLIESNWDRIFNSLKITFKLIKDFGYSKENLSSNNALIPIAFYIFKNNIEESYLDQKSKFEDDKKNIKKWLVLSLMKKAFSGQPDNILLPIREIIDESELFPTDKIIQKFKGHTKTLVFSDDDIENLLIYKYGQASTFSVLTILYPHLDFRNKFHIDHIHPKNPKKSELKKLNFNDVQIERFFNQVHNLYNLQLIDSTINVEKQNLPFDVWLDTKFTGNIENFKEKNFIPNNESIKLINFENFFNERKELMIKKLKEILQ